MRLHSYVVRIVIKRSNGRTEVTSIRSARNALDATIEVLKEQARIDPMTFPLLATAKPY